MTGLIKSGLTHDFITSPNVKNDTSYFIDKFQKNIFLLVYVVKNISFLDPRYLSIFDMSINESGLLVLFRVLLVFKIKSK